MTTLSDLTRSTLRAAPSTSLRALPLVAVVLDVALVSATTYLAVLGRESITLFPADVELGADVRLIGPSVAAGWVVIMLLVGGYRRNVFGVGTEEYKRALTTCLVAAGLTGVTCYLAKYPLSRGYFILAVVIGTPAVLLGRWLLRRALQAARRRGHLQHRVLLVGAPAYVDEVAAVLRRESWLGYGVVGALLPAPAGVTETALGIPVVGSSREVTSAVRSSGADVVFFASGALETSSDMRRIAWDLEHDAVQVVVAPSVTDVSSERVRVRPVGGLPLVHIDPPRATDASRWGKRLFDLVGSFVLLLLFTPLLAVIAAQVWLHDRGPVLFRQVRVGRNGEHFSCLKFRTMCIDAEERLAQLHRDVGHDGGLFKLKDDPRITRPGRWLRRYSVDELPQLVNVLRGEMSLVGPRPPLPTEVARYEADTERRLRVRPGMTGLWQVSGRADLSWSETVRLDLYYVDNWSMLQDLSILAKTLRAVLGSRGAY